MNTCNYSEDCLGYSTFYGDSAGDYAPIRMYTVTEVRAIGAYLGLICTSGRKKHRMTECAECPMRRRSVRNSISVHV